MLKNILKLEGAQQLSKNEQKIIKGGAYCIKCFSIKMTQAECADEGGRYYTSTGTCRICENICL